MAISAIVTRRTGLLTKVFQYVIPQTICGLAISFHDLEPVSVPLSDKFYVLGFHFLKDLIIKKELVYHYILCRKQQDTPGILPVTSCTPRFLIIVLHALRHIVMDHEPDV